MTTTAAARPSGLARAVIRSPSLRLVGRRLLTAVPVLWGISLLTFAVMNLLPGDAAEQLLGTDATPQQLADLRAKLHTSDPFWVRYGHWIGGVLHGNLGDSLQNGQPVSGVLQQRLPPTLELVILAFIISVGFAVPVAVLAARRPNGVADRLSAAISIVGLSIAPYVLALLLILLFAVKLAVLPAIGYVPLTQDLGGNIESMVLPSVSIGFPLFCFYTRLLRADIVDQMTGEDYVVTARAKGVGPWRVLVRHALRNSIFGLLTLVAVNLGTLIGVTVIVEQIFSLPGIGQELLRGINSRDIVVVEDIVLVFAVVVVLANLLTDLLYALLDPRIRYGRAAS